MAITKPIPKATADDFIAAAPDSEVKAKGVKKGNKQQISLTIALSITHIFLANNINQLGDKDVD